MQIHDAGGNILTAATDSITLAINNDPGSGTLSGTMTVSAVSGEASFGNISIDKVGTGYTLDASGGGVPLVTSNGFNITVGSPAQLTYNVEPSNTQSVTSISPAI